MPAGAFVDVGSVERNPAQLRKMCRPAEPRRNLGEPARLNLKHLKISIAQVAR